MELCIIRCSTRVLFVKDPFPPSVQTWIEVFRQIFQWPYYVNNAAFVTSVISIILYIVMELINSKFISRVKVCCCVYSRRDRKWHTLRRFPFPLRIPVALILVCCISRAYMYMCVYPVYVCLIHCLGVVPFQVHVHVLLYVF